MRNTILLLSKLFPPIQSTRVTKVVSNTSQLSRPCSSSSLFQICSFCSFICDMLSLCIFFVYSTNLSLYLAINLFIFVCSSPLFVLSFCPSSIPFPFTLLASSVHIFTSHLHHFLFLNIHQGVVGRKLILITVLLTETKLHFLRFKSYVHFHGSKTVSMLK